MNPAQFILVGLLRIYRCVLSPAKNVIFGPLAHCRFTPTCSEYSLTAIRDHGAIRGLWLSLKRLGRCHPWGGCGFDPVPAALRESGCASLEPMATQAILEGHPYPGDASLRDHL